MNSSRLGETAALLTLFIGVLTFGQPYGELRTVAFGLCALILIAWRGK